MQKGRLIVAKTQKGSVYVQLDRLNGKPPMPLSHVSFKDTAHNGKDCDFEFINGRVTKIVVDGSAVFAGAVQVGNVGNNQSGRISNDPKTTFLVPAETALPKSIAEKITGDIDNFSLKLNKTARLIPDNKGKPKFYFFKNDWRKNKAGEETGHKFMIESNFGNIDFGQIEQRLISQRNITFKNNKAICFSPDWRLVLGIGGSSVYETSITLHHIYGIPFIPASSIKGVLRSWMIQENWGCELDGEANAFHESRLMCDIFGCPEKIEFGENKPKLSRPSWYKVNAAKGLKEKQGNIMFFDAFPTTAPKMEADIMNVHYPDWYSDKDGRVAPTDFQSPIPIPFLTVGKKAQNGADLQFGTFIAVKENHLFDFSLHSNDKLINKWIDSGQVSLLDLIEKWLGDALTNHGIGAKTAVGYGYMKSV